MKNKIFITLAGIIFCFGCGSNIKENEDKIYSRHLQKQMELAIISTPASSDKSDFNLLILNDGQDMQKLRVKETVDSLWKEEAIKPLLVVGVKAVDRNEIYGVAGMPDYQGNGKWAEKYKNFIKNELLAFVKKKSGVRKFNSVILAGNTLGGLSAFDIAWENWQQIDRVGVFSGSFYASDKDVNDQDYSVDKNRLIINKITSSRKKPKLKYWFYAGPEEKNSIGQKATGKDIIGSTKDLIELIKKKKVCPPGDIILTEIPNGKNDYASWSRTFPDFLLWAVGK